MRSIRTAVSIVVSSFAIALVGCSSAGENLGESNDAVDYICNESPKATLDGIPAYAYCGNFNVWSNNGSDTKSSSGGSGWVQSEGGYGYQCVEYAVRYEHFKFDVAVGWGNAYAYEMCGNHPSSMSKVTTPVHGDLIIFAPGSCGADGTAGHVAVVDTVNASTVSVVQENSAGKYTYNKSCASCWLHAAKNTPTNADAGKDAAQNTDAAPDVDSGEANDSGSTKTDAAPPPEADAGNDGGATSSGCAVGIATPRSAAHDLLLFGLAIVLIVLRRVKRG